VDELEFITALDRIITEFIISFAGKLNERQTRIETFLSVQSLTLDSSELAGMITQSGAISINIEAMIRDAQRAYEQSLVSGAQSGRADVQRRDGAYKLWTWQTESDKPCPDCVARGGQTHEYQFWESVGLPQSGSTICGSYCKCVLVPA
jgi:hypothetical protein